MTAVWDTSLLWRLQPERSSVRHLADRAVAGAPVRVAAPALLEAMYGYERAIASDRRFSIWMVWLRRIVAARLIDVVALDGRAALVAGRVRARAPHAPPARRGDRRTKTMRQAAWLIDIQIAATAFAAGLDVATSNRGDFERIAAVLADLFPDAIPLRVTTPAA